MGLVMVVADQSATVTTPADRAMVKEDTVVAQEAGEEGLRIIAGTTIRDMVMGMGGVERGKEWEEADGDPPFQKRKSYRIVERRVIYSSPSEIFEFAISASVPAPRCTLTHSLLKNGWCFFGDTGI
jgi:hypothetical protein